MQTTASDQASGRLSLSDLAAVAIWMGVFAGLIEGGLLLAAQHFGWLTWNMKLVAVRPPILWASPVLDTLLFMLVGLPLWAALKFFRRWSSLRLTVFVFTTFAFFSWIAVPGTGRLAHSAMLVLAAGLASIAARMPVPRLVAMLQFTRRTLPAAVALPLVLWGGLWLKDWAAERSMVANLPPARPGSPNILLVIVDALRADHLQAYGYSRPTSPTLSQIAEQGVLFENAVATSSWTLPSHASVLTGRLPASVGALENPLRPCALTLPEVLAGRGYRTAAISGNTWFFSRAWGFESGFHHFEDSFENISDALYRTIYGRKLEQFLLRRIGFGNIPGRRSAADVVSAGLHWIDRHRGKPFFVVLNLYDAHDPYLPPPPYRAMFSPIPEPGGRINSFELRDNSNLTAAQIQSEVDAYDGAIAYVDAEIRRLLTELQSRDGGDNTVVLVTSDHGESFGEHGLFIHGDGLYRELIHVPLLIQWKNHLPAGRLALPVSLAAIPATLLDLLEETPRPEFVWSSLRPLWEGKDTSSHPWPVSQLARKGLMQSVVKQNWHYIQHADGQEELYDWAADPQEANNRAPDLQFASLLAEFRAQLAAQPAPPASACGSKEPIAGKSPLLSGNHVQGPLRP